MGRFMRYDVSRNLIILKDSKLTPIGYDTIYTMTSKERTINRPAQGIKLDSSISRKIFLNKMLSFNPLIKKSDLKFL